MPDTIDPDTGFPVDDSGVETVSVSAPAQRATDWATLLGWVVAIALIWQMGKDARYWK